METIEQLKSELLAARAEVERNHDTLCALTTLLLGSDRGCWTKGELVAAVAALRAQLATAKEELKRTQEAHQYEHDDRIAVQQERDSLRSDLAKANAAVEEAKRERDAETMRANCYKTEAERWQKWREEQPWLAELNSYRSQVARLVCEKVETTDELASLRAQLAAQQSVPPEARAVEAENILTAQLALPPDKRDWNEVHRAALSLRTVVPPGEGGGVGEGKPPQAKS